MKNWLPLVRTTEIVQFVAKLVFKAVTPDALTAATGGGGVTALDHKVLDDTVEHDAVVIAVFGVGGEILHRLGGKLREQADGDVAHSGVHNRHQIALHGQC